VEQLIDELIPRRDAISAGDEEDAFRTQWQQEREMEAFNEKDTHFSKLFTDDDYYQAAKEKNYALAEALDPEATAKRSLVNAYLEHRLGREIPSVNYEPERDAFAMQAFGQKNLNDGQLFDFIRGDYDWQKQRTEAINDLQMQSVGKAIADSQLGQTRPFVDGMTEVFNQWQQKYPELVDGKNDAAFLSQGYKLYYDTINDLDTVRPQASKALSTLTAFTQGNATDEDMQSLANDFVGAPPEDRQKIYKYVTLAAQAGQIDRAGIEQFAINMGQAFTRGFDFVPQGTLQIQEAGVNDVLQKVKSGQKVLVPQNGDISKATVAEQTPKAQVLGQAPTVGMFATPQDGYREATPEEADQFTSYATNAMESFKVVRELRNVAKTGVDPIRPVLEEKSFWGTAERGAYGLSGSIPLMGATAVNPYLGVLAYQATEYDRIMLENPEINPQFAQGLALVEGAANAAIDRVQLSSLSGRLPMFGRYLDRIASNGVRRTVKIGANVVEQNLQEGAQDLIAPVLETAVAALREDMPDKDFGKLLNEWGGQRAETFFATLPLALIGGGVATYRDIKNPSAELNATKLRQAGFDKEQTTFIQRAENPEEYTARIQMEWDKRTPEAIEAGRQEVIAEMQKAATPDENSAKLSETVAEDGTRRWVVTAPDGKELLQTQDQQAALDAIAQHGHAQLLNNQFEALYEPQELRQIINDRITNWKSQDSNNTLVMESEGMNAQQKLEQLQAAGNALQIQELHNRIANSHLKDTPYEQINILGEASVDDVSEMVFKSLITINPNTRPENLREEIHHTAVKVALRNGSVTLDTLRGWLDATEKALPGTFQNLVRDSEGDIVESLAQVQAAYEDGKIDANEASALPASFIDYIKNMMRTFAEVLRRAVALRGAFKDGALPAEYESFLAESVGLNQQTMVDTTRERVGGELTQGTFNYSIGQRVLTDTNPYPMEDKGKWWANEDFAQRGGRIVTMSPDEFLSQVRPLEVDEASRDNIDDLKNMMQSGRKLDPLAIYADGKEDGRHRATAAKELGMATIPVLDFRENKPKGNDFSIGSRTNAVSTDTPSIRASNATITGPANYSIGAFHGTPHKVDKFSTAKIGTGEGAQAYGWGLYFAENQGVAEQYRKGLTEKDFILKVRSVFSEFDDVNEQEQALTEIPLSDGQRKLLDVLKREDWWGFDYPHQAVQAALREPENFDPSPELYDALKSFGNSYTVELDVEPEELLDWDKPLSEQSEFVKKRLEEFAVWYEAKRMNQLDTATGANFYNRYTKAQGRPELASDYLLRAGIPGIRYLDGGSRSVNATDERLLELAEKNNGNKEAAVDEFMRSVYDTPKAKEKMRSDLLRNFPERTSNYVVFDENLIKITEENGNRIPASQALAGPATGVAVENGRAFSPIVRDLLQRRAAGEDIPRSVIDQAINDNFPAQLVEPPKTESELPSRATIDDAINEGQRRDQIAKSNIQPGEAVTIRQDVPAMTRKGVGVVTIKGKSGNSYDAAARISDPQFILNEKKSLEIGMGGAKGPHIAIRGKWSSDQSMPADLNQWTQVGFNPDRHSFYYDRATMKQVVGGSEAYQIGNTVFVKDAQFGDGQISNISYSIASVEHFKNDKRFDKLVKDGRVVIGHDIEEFKGMHILLHSPDNAFAGTIKLTDGEEIQGKGGVYYPALFADKNYFWASTEAMVMRSAKHLNEIGKKNDGKILMGLVSAPVEKLFSSSSMAGGVVKFLNALSSDAKGGLSKAKLNSMLVTASKVKVVKPGKGIKKFRDTLKASDGLAGNLAKMDSFLEPTGSIFEVRKMFVESLAEQLSVHLGSNSKASEYVAGILTDAENKHAKNSIKRGKLSKASILQGLGNMLTEPFLRDFQDHGNGKIYAVLEVDGMVDGVASTAHESYPFTLVPRNKKSKVKLHVLNQAVDWQDVVGKETGQYATPQERLNLMPTSGMSSTTLKVLGVKGGSKANPLNYSIASQSEIDRVNRALGGMNRGPDERLKVYQRAKQKFSKLMAWNSDELGAMADTGSDETQIRRNQLLQGFGELDAILEVLPPEVRGRVGGYTVLANIAPMDVFKDGVKVSESKNMDGAIISAWMKEGQNIGQAGKQVSLPPGYTAKENLASKRADKALADFFRDRIKKIDTELEKVLVREYTEAIAKAVKQSRPKAGDNGVRKSTLGAETQKFADMVQRATLLDDEATPKRMAEIEAALANPDATAEDISALSEEWSILNTFGDLDNRSSETLAQGLDWLKGQLQMGREAWRIKEQARIDEQRARAAATIEWLGKGTAKKRNKTKTTSQLASDLANHYLLSHASFEQFVTAIFPPEIAATWSDRLRKADEASQASEIRDRKGILDAVREGAKAANMSAGDAMLWLKGDQKNAVAYLEDRKVKDERIAIDLAQKIVTGEADRSKLNDADIETLRNELAALPADTQKEYVTIKRVIFRGKDVKLDMSRGKAIQYLLSWNQPDVQIKMRKEGWTDESAADLKALVNDPVSRSVINYLQSLYGKGAGIVNPVYSRMFGMTMPQVKNYAPTRFLNANDSKDIGLDGSPTATGTTPSFAKSRVTHSAKIAPEDALTVAQGHIAQQAHWVHFAELAREFRAILSNPEVRESIKQTHGESVLKDAELWADQLEQRGGNKARESTWMTTILGAATAGKAVSLLGFNLKSFAMNLDNSIRFALTLDMKQVVSALSNPATITEDIQTVWESDAVQNRLQGGASAEARFLFSRYAGKPNFAAKIAEASMTPHNWLDSAATSISSAIVYRANLNDALAAGMPENLAKQTALDATSQAIYRFAQPVSFGQRSLVENNGNVLAKMFFLFMSDPRLKTAILADAARGLATGRGDKWTHIRRILVVETMAVLSHVVASAYRDAFSDDDDEEIWNRGGFAKAILLAPLQGFFFAGTVGELAISKLTGQKTFNSTTQNPLLSSMEQALRAGSNLEDAFDIDDPDAMLKEWNNIFRSMALSPAMAAPAVLLNMVKPALGLYQNATTEE